MKLKNVLSAIIFMAVSFSAVHAQSGNVQMKSLMDSVAYSIGTQLGSSLKNDSLFLDLDILKAGAQDAMSGREPRLSPEVMTNVMEQLGNQIQEKQMQKQMAIAQESMKKGKDFLNNNKTQQGVKTTPSGLQYKVLTEGTGKAPLATDTVKVHYHGTLIDGSVFDSSVERDEPVSFPLDKVIPGWTEGVQLMKEGSKFVFYIPSELAYGERGAGAIGPNETLIFEVELLEVRKP
jgi:FKBP-type peptidyl-prolyl cis-trans isomerase